MSSSAATRAVTPARSSIDRAVSRMSPSRAEHLNPVSGEPTWTPLVPRRAAAKLPVARRNLVAVAVEQRRLTFPQIWKEAPMWTQRERAVLRDARHLESDLVHVRDDHARIAIGTHRQHEIPRAVGDDGTARPCWHERQNR